jgi:GNAT superfamily N-acetyltransferase
MTGHIEQIRDTRSEVYREVMDVYINSFPSNERQSLDTIEQRVIKGKTTLFVLFEEKIVVGFAMLLNLAKSQFVLLDYFAIKSEFRSKGWGSRLLSNISNYAHSNGKTVVLEIEHPAFGDNKDDRHSRLKFYLQNRCYILENVRYILPSLDGSEKTEMLLMVMSPDCSRIYTNGEIRELITMLYSEVYDKDMSDTDLQLMLHLLPQKINLNTSI